MDSIHYSEPNADSLLGPPHTKDNNPFFSFAEVPAAESEILSYIRQNRKMV